MVTLYNQIIKQCVQGGWELYIQKVKAQGEILARLVLHFKWLYIVVVRDISVSLDQYAIFLS